jgi:hypothetical protein
LGRPTQGPVVQAGQEGEKKKAKLLHDARPPKIPTIFKKPAVRE